MKVISRSFGAGDCVAGHPALDLVNTVTARNTGEPIDWLDGYARLVEWARVASVVDERTASILLSSARQRVHASSRALARAKHVREALHVVCSALIRHAPIPASTLDTIEAAAKRAHGRMRLAPGAGRPRADGPT